MHALSSKGRVLTVGALATTCVLLPSPAFADRGTGSSDTSVNTSAKRSGHTLESRITYSGSARGSGGKSSGNVTPVGNWTPPACWYEPVSAAEFKKKVEGEYDEVVNDSQQPNYAKSATGQFRDIYKNGKYKDYNLDEADEGNWWVSVQNPDRLDDPAAFTCSELPFWVLNGDVPPVRNAVTPQVLAELAYNRLTLPDTKVTLAPRDITKVNLPTWAWLDKATFTDVSVTASLNVAGLDISATTTAKPVSLTLDPGTSDAETYPASGECRLNDDDSIGEPYAKGKTGETPPCGIKYLRSSGDGTFKLRATITWNVTWTGTGGAGGDLPDGTFGTTQDITVQEIQSVNR
ncbi:hypothetical protein [Streptomyces sp. NBC_00151]|uniref:hypothetical protein n=1 Tax=Streptomyces sp. NBC_00151 TaxID=2975669 RepID=UPI002DD9FD1D|nr:hypothetical protein [Streptomyces sp. NBC_00151]